MNFSDLTKIEVGKASPFPERKNFDGSFFEVDQNGFLFLLYMSGMTSKEKKDLKKEVIQARVYIEGDNVLTLIRFGVSSVIFELSFDPTLYPDNRAYNLIEKTNMVLIVGIDSKDNTIQVLRYANFPDELRKIYMKHWFAVKDDKDFNKQYNQWLQAIYNKYSTIQLWNQSKRSGVFGKN